MTEADAGRLEFMDERLFTIQGRFRDAFGWDEVDDRASAVALVKAVEDVRIALWSRSMREATLASLRGRLARGQPTAVLGAAVEPVEVISALAAGCSLVAADGGVGVLEELPASVAEVARQPLLLVVSDGDGGLERLLAVADRGVPFAVHAHGDNEQEWRTLLTEFADSATPPPLILTHQTPTTLRGADNPGGFTDGDRAACLLVALGCAREDIRLLGFQSDVVGRWSGDTDQQIKLRKLKWMDEVLDILFKSR
ncbi:MAG TPA: hypothetical protein EYM62_01045 [Candidatus Poseidoniales archaeon]|nr:hypothetical protein [Candidatus Poseidoniales archaeon]